MNLRNVLAGALALVGGGVGLARADLTPLQHVDLSNPAVRRAQQFSTACAKQLIVGDYRQALQLCDQGLAINPSDAWLHYNRGEALVGMARVDEALPELTRAEQLFGRDDVWARSVALYGRANALYNTGRCREASQAFETYSSLVGGADPNGARIASLRKGTCKPGLPIASRPVAPTERVPVGGTEHPDRQPPKR